MRTPPRLALLRTGVTRRVVAMASLAALAACAARQPARDAGHGADAPKTADVVRTTGGLLTGTSATQPGIRAFLGVPFAAPPVGELRWRPPQPAAPWSGVRTADRFAPACMQPAPVPFGPWTAEFLLRGPVSEDCLYLNVWSGARAGERLPVLVFLYGGGFTSGATDVPIYDGARLATRGLVVVTIAYRVGALGFLAHPELTRESPAHASGNYGLLDQVAGLRWVHDNIAAFGGDPARVTVSGQSAGAMSVVLLTASARATGLFHRAIVESGPGALASFGVPSTASLTRPLGAAEGDGVRFAAAMGATSLAALRALPAAAFAQPAGNARFGPVVDGLFLTSRIDSVIAGGRANDVPMLVGMNADEGSFAPGYGRSTVDAYRTALTARYGTRATALVSRYPAGTDDEAGRASMALARDVGLASLHTTLTERASTAKTPAYAYLFSRVPPWPERPEFRVFHTAEVPYVFGTLDVVPRPWTAVDRQLSDVAMRYWANFATRGDPNGAGLVAWPAFEPGRGAFLELGDDVRVRQAPDSAVRALVVP